MRAAVLSAFFAALFALPAPSPAAVDLPEETVVGSADYGTNEDRYISPGTVSVIRPDDKLGEQRTIPELLEDTPGLNVISVQGRNGYSVASVRGSTAAEVAVYIDGVLMNLQSESAVDLSAIPADSVERIEVYRGYIPSRFGAQAMGGVINIVTKMPEKPSTTVSLGAASFGRYKGTLSHGSPMWGGKFFGSFGYETYKGDFPYRNDNNTPYNNTDDYNANRRDNGFNNTDALLKWEDEHWKARFSYSKRDRDLPLQAPGSDKDGVTIQRGALLDTTRWDVSLGRSQTAGSVNWGWEIIRTEQGKDYDSRRSPQQSPIANVVKSSYDTSRTGISLNADWSAGERHFFEFLAEYSDESLKVDGDMLRRTQYLNGIDNYDMSSWYLALQDTIALDRSGSFTATPSLRWHNQDGDSELTWQVALTKEFSRSWMLKSSFGTYSRAPNMYENYGDGAFILPSASNLKWETGTQFDISAIWNGEPSFIKGSKARASLSYFRRDSDNLIEFNMTSPTFGRYENVAKAKVNGVEFEGAIDVDLWSLSLSATWLDGVNDGDTGTARDGGKALPNRPEWSGSARLTRKFGEQSRKARGTGSVFAEYRYIGENYADFTESVLFDAQGIWNLGFKYALSPTSELALGINDVFDAADGWKMRPNGAYGPERILWYPIEGRSYYLTLTMEL
ncbi:vitamin B12 transporter BtuB [Synergistales bacterium]|nr:vitamin B12 transporter BtuB [Synergistales bacterium]